MARYLIGNIKGPAGYSPSASVVQTSNGATITITDATGTTTANIRNGVDGDGNNIDLSPYATKTEVAAIADNIELANYASKTYVDNAVQNVSAPVQSVNGMIGNVVISVPEPLTAGDNITIQNNTISANYLEEDPVFSISPAASITQQDIETWNNSNSFSGDYDDLTNKPDLTNYATISQLVEKQNALTAGTGLDITNNTISIDNTVALKTDVPNISGLATTAALTAGLAAKQNTLTAGTNITIDANNVISASGGSNFSGDYDDLTNKPDLTVYAETADLATVATTGDYDDLTNKPTIPVLPTLATVATSGSYTDLSNKPAIPIYTAGTGIEIYNGSILVDTDLIPVRDDIPTNVSDLTNDEGFITSADLPANELPSYSSSDEGKVLAVDDNGDLEWTTPASSSSYSDADVATYISNTFGMSSTRTSGITVWGQTNYPTTINADSSGEIELLSDNFNPFGNLQQVNVEFDVVNYQTQEVVEQISQTASITSYYDDEYSAMVNFECAAEEMTFSIDTWDKSTWWLESIIWNKYADGYEVVNFQLTFGSGIQTIKTPIDEDFIPNTIARVSDIPSGGGSSENTYTAGYGIEINNDEISIDENVVATKSEIPESYGDDNVGSYIQYHFGLYDGSSTTDVNSPDYSVDSTGTLTVTSGWTPNPSAVVELNGDDGYGNGMQVCQFELQYNDNTNKYEATSLVENYSDFTIEYDENTGETTLNYDWEYFNDNNLPIFHFTQWITVESYDTLNDKYISNNIARTSDVQDLLPVHGTSDEGKVLSVDSNGDLEWATPSSGGGSGGSSPQVVYTSSLFSSTDWEPIALQIQNAFVNQNMSLLPTVIVSGMTVYTLALLTNFSSGGDMEVTYIKNSTSPINRYSNSLEKLNINMNFVCFMVSKSTGSISSFYRPYGGGEVITTSMVDTGLTMSNGYLQVNTGLIARKQDVPTTSANAASAIYLKDTNNVKYEIKVDTSGNLIATQV